MTRTFLAGILFTLLNYLGQAQDTIRTSSLDEVIITANKFPLKTSRTGKVVNVITREQLEKAGGKDLSQVLNEQVGLYMNGANSNAGKDKTVFMRGAKIDYTLITIDGVPVYDASGIGGNFDIRMIPIDIIERVEILKGSQSTLYGSDAIAGVINIITKKGSKKLFNVSALLNAGSYGTVRASTNISGNVKTFDYNIGLSTFNTDGINETIDTSGNKGERDGYQQHTIMANIGWKPAEGINIRPFIRFTDTKADVDNGSFIDELDNTADQKNLQSGIKAQWKIGRANLNLLYNYNFTDRLYQDDSTKSRNGYYLFSSDSYKAKEHFAEAYLHAPINSSLHLTTGLDFRRSSTQQEHFAIDDWGTYPSAIGDDSVSQKQVGVYAALNGKFNNGMNLELGGRWNNHSSYGNNFVYSINPSWLLNKQYKLFVNVSTAYKTPGLYQLFSEYGNKDLQPESAFTIEGGLQYFDPGDRFTARAVYFNRKIKDVMFFYYDPNTWKAQYINQDKQDDHGIELEGSLNITKTVQWRLNYTYVTGKVTTVNAAKDTSYFNLLRRPKSTFGTTFSWQACDRLYLSANLQAYGKRSDVGFDPSTYSSYEVELKPFMLLGLYADYGFCNNRFHVFVDIRNITNSKYQEVYGYNNPGINAYGGIRVEL